MTNPGVLDPETGEYLRFVCTLQDTDQLRVYREAGRLVIQQIISGQAVNGFGLLDEQSSLWTLPHGTHPWQRTADAGAEKLYLTLSFCPAFATLVMEDTR